MLTVRHTLELGFMRQAFNTLEQPDLDLLNEQIVRALTQQDFNALSSLQLHLIGCGPTMHGLGTLLICHVEFIYKRLYPLIINRYSLFIFD